MIYTCTFSPAIDYVTFLDTLHPGNLNRATKVGYYPGGKGINISRVLKRLTIDNTALGFVGGFTGAFMKTSLLAEDIQTDFIEINEPTRINVKVKAEKETEINGPTPLITEEEIHALYVKLENYLKKDDWFVLSGSIPESVPATFFRDISILCKERQAKWIVDTSGINLKKLIAYQPFLIKPNKDELSELVGKPIHSIDEAVQFAKEIVAGGTNNVVISLGGDGALLINRSLTLKANAPKGKVVNTVGAGDSVVSGIIASYSKHENWSEAFRFGIAAGSATAFSEDLCTLEGIENLKKEIQISPIQRGMER